MDYLWTRSDIATVHHLLRIRTRPRICPQPFSIPWSRWAMATRPSRQRALATHADLFHRHRHHGHLRPSTAQLAEPCHARQPPRIRGVVPTASPPPPPDQIVAAANPPELKPTTADT
eukprot:jgi/Ulvmu1/12568/UM091_0010.1